MAAGGLDLGGEADREAAAAGAAGLELAGLDPLVDDVVGDVEALSDVVDAELVVAEWGWRGDAVVPAQPAHGVLVERAAAGGQLTGLVETVGELGVGVRGPEFAQQLGDFGGARGAGGAGSQDGQLFAVARAPVDPDADLGVVGLGGERDVVDQRAQQPLAVAVRGREVVRGLVEL